VEILDLFPWTIYGAVAEDKQHWNWNATSLTTPGPVGVNPQVGVVNGLVISGDKHSTRSTHRPNNAVEWRWKKTESNGVVSVTHFYVAQLYGIMEKGSKERWKWKLLLGRGNGMIEVMRGSCKHGHGGMDDPILFNPVASVGNLALPAGDIDLAKLTEDERMKLTPLVKEFRCDP
jgi:hypothetical protein